MYLPQDLGSTIKEIMQSKNIKAKDMLEACELSINTLSNLNHNKAIGFDSLAKIADYLDVSVDYLLGRTEHMSCSTNSGSVINSGSNNNIQNGNNIINSNNNNIAQSAPIENDDVWATYSKLSTKDKLEVQLDILNRGHK
ncbi:MAG: helix-turn-helix transcriptional regulator [Treponema sp.]|nr:helix-turn-helix transcriptional regulator [Treponema sp.]MDY5757866.1 helix-turn-helix transcriptional regulator [Treponema sp.]